MSEFSIAAVFSDNMVLQRDKCINVFGDGAEGKTVSVSLNGAVAQAKVINGKWNAVLPPMQAGNGYEMTVSCEGAVKIFKNVAIGEVWLAGGQSNMEFRLHECLDGDKVVNSDKDPNVRFYDTVRLGFIDDDFLKQESATHWEEFSPQAAPNWTAVGYFFAKRLAAELGVTVGILGCNYGGTSLSSWVSTDLLKTDSELNAYLRDYTELVGDKSEEQQIAEYKAGLDYYYTRVAKTEKYIADHPTASEEEIIANCGADKPIPMGCAHPLHPGGLYNAMLCRVNPYSIRGFIFYQGESDAFRAHLYYKLFSRTIQLWREDWDDDLLPFLFVQLPFYLEEGKDDDELWCYVREAQSRVADTVKNTGMAVIVDHGEHRNIHPINKAPVGERLALQALYSVYKLIDDENAVNGPIYRSLEYKDNGIELSFDYAKDGLVVKGEENNFEIADESKQFKRAVAEIRGDKIFVYSDQVKNPKYARYCWRNYSVATIFGKNGIPLSPFRTSRF